MKIPIITIVLAILIKNLAGYHNLKHIHYIHKDSNATIPTFTSQDKGLQQQVTANNQSQPKPEHQTNQTSQQIQPTNQTYTPQQNQSSLNSTQNSLIESQTNTTNTTQTTNHTVQAQPVQEESGGNTLIIVLLAIIVVLIVVILVLLHLKKKYLVDPMDPEKGISKPDLSLMDNQKLKTWKFNVPPLPVNPQCTINEDENHLGKFISITFTQRGVGAIISNKPIGKAQNPIIYFEIEIDMIQPDTNIAIGFCNAKEFAPDNQIGQTTTSVAFFQNGELKKGNKVLFDYQKKSEYGDCLGIGLTKKDGRVWLSHNGQFLNEPPPSEKMTQKERDKLKKQKEQDGDEDDEEEQLREQILEIEQKRKKVQMTGKILELYPVICCTGPCAITLNIGGQPFKLFQKEIAKGLICVYSYYIHNILKINKLFDKDSRI